MINFNDTFFFELSFSDLGASEENGIKLDCEYCSFPDSEKNQILSMVELFDEYLELYNQISSGSFKWSLRKDDEDTKNVILGDTIVNEKLIIGEDLSWNEIDQGISGRINIPSIDDAFGGDKNSPLGYYVTALYLELNPQSFIPIDIGSPLTACLKIEHGKLVNNVLVIDDEAMEIYDMQIDLSKYFELAYSCKVFHNWQSAYVFKEKARNSILMKHLLPILFPVPSLDLSDF